MIFLTAIVKMCSISCSFCSLGIYWGINLRLNFEQKVKASVAIFYRIGSALPTDKVLQALELTILTLTDWFRNISPKLSRTYLTASNYLWVELVCFSRSLNFAEQTSLFKRFRIKTPYASSLAPVNIRQVVNALGLNVYPL